MTAVSVAPVEYRPPTAQRHAQLDGLRAVAVLLVVVAHTIGGGFDVLGGYGVGLFFVLSAYLITGILLRQRGQPIGAALRTFYLRRALRIFPAYYIVLAVLLAANVSGVRGAWPWHALYLSNWYVAMTGQWELGVTHLWTLSVEEQFYLTWPLVALLVRRLDLACVGMIALAVAGRGSLATITTSAVRIGTPTFASLDALAIGALLAWWQHTDTRLRLDRWLIAGLALYLAALALRVVGRGAPVMMAIDALGIALVALWCIARATEGGFPWMEWAPLQSLGRISYGVYLWHMPVIWWLVQRGAVRGTLGFFLLTSALTLGIAAVSWRYVEAPFNQLKSWLPYR